MIVNDKYKFCYTHIMKCGGTSVRKWLLNIPGSREEFPLPGHCHDSICHGPKYCLNPDWFHFCTIRDPRSWYLSIYKSIQPKNDTNENFIFGDPYHLPFDEWVERALNPKEWINKSNHWSSDIASWVSKREILISPLDVGWFTFRNLFQLSNYLNTFNITKDELNHRFFWLLDVNCMIKQEHLNEMIANVLYENCRIPWEFISEPPPHHNVTAKYNTDLDEHYDERLTNMVYTQDDVWYNKIYNTDAKVIYIGE